MFLFYLDSLLPLSLYKNLIQYVVFELVAVKTLQTIVSFHISWCSIGDWAKLGSSLPINNLFLSAYKFEKLYFFVNYALKS